jgi:hypothetical protein
MMIRDFQEWQTEHFSSDGLHRLEGTMGKGG